MEWILYSVPALILIGAGLAVYERHKKTTLLKHDLSLGKTDQTESIRDGYRAQQAFAETSRGGGFISSDNSDH